jgi:hypothetical protein
MRCARRGLILFRFYALDGLRLNINNQIYPLLVFRQACICSGGLWMERRWVWIGVGFQVSVRTAAIQIKKETEERQMSNVELRNSVYFID